VGGEALPPLADGVPVASQLLSELLIGGVVVDRSVEDEATAEHQGLRRGARADEGFELLSGVRSEDKARTERTGHDVPPCTSKDDEAGRVDIMVAVGAFVQRDWRRIYETVI
jgi:hypothetical protein